MSPERLEGPGDATTLAGASRLRNATALAVKETAGQFLYRSGFYRTAWRDRAVIVLFHRVDDRYPADPITCSRAQFAQFCDFFTRYFIVVSLSELLDRLKHGQDISRRLAITFDDGYRDNHEFAAQELRRRRLPACFFIAPGFLGTQTAAWWDARASIASEWMTWDQVRSVRAAGFEIGAHTITHADCGDIKGGDAIREIGGSKTLLEQEVGAPIEHFAYPYGDPRHMTEQNRAVVRSAGFSSCLAAHGGIVRATDDPYHLHRIPINSWYTSAYHFGFEVLRMALRGSR